MLYYGVLLFFFVEYIRPGMYVPAFDVLHLNAVLPLTVVGGTMLSRTRFPSARVLSDVNGRVLTVWLGLLILSVGAASVTEYAVDTLSDVVGYLLIAWAISMQLSDIQRIQGAMKVLLAVHLVIAAMNPVLFTDPENRNYIVAGPFLGDGNDFALSLNIVIPFALYLFQESRKTRQRLFWGGTLALIVMMVILTKSRGGTVGLLAVAFYYWLKSRRKVVTASLAAAALAMVLALAPQSYFDRMRQVADTEEGSAQGRILAWTAATQMAVQNPVFGVGAGNFATSYGAFFRTRTDVPWQNAHSIYFLALGELGFPGLIVVLAFVGGNIVASHRLLKRIRAADDTASNNANLVVAVAASAIAYASGGAFLSALYYPHMYIIAGLNTATRLAVTAGILQGASDARTTPLPSRRSVRPDAISPDWRPGAAAGHSTR